MTAQLGFQCDYTPRVNFALQQNDIPVIRLLRVDNLTDARVEDIELRVSADPMVFEPWTTRIAAIDAHATYNLRSLPLALSADRLAAQTESEAGRIRVDAFVAGAPAGSIDLDFEILAFNQWSGLRSLPELLAAFVLPNQPAIETVLKVARRHLERLVGDPSFNGYQERSRQRVVAMSAAIYGAIQDLGITYVNPPASFEQEGQKVRLPDQLLASQMGTCLDLTVLLAACLEQAGLNPFVNVVEGHAFPGVWLDDFSLPEPSISDPTAVRKRVDGEEALVFDSSAAAMKADFRHATAVARRALEDTDKFICAVDIRRARVAKIRPLPVRRTELGWQAIPDAVPDSPPPLPASSIPQLHLPAEDARSTAETTRTRLDRWKGKLLDLSLRNRLLNVRFSLKSIIPLESADIGVLEDVLAGGAKLALLPRPDEREVFGPRSSQLLEQRVNEDPMRTFLADALDRRRLHADLAPADLQSRLTKLHRDSRTALEETGSNTLYLALGFLSWFEADNSETERFAPLVLLPVALHRGSAHEAYRVSVTDDDPRINVTLLKKLETEFGVDVRGLDEMPEDDAGLDITLILNRFRKAVMTIPRWEVKAIAAIGEFSFAKYLMWTDLEDRTQTLLANSLFEHIMNGKGAPYPLERPFASPESIDAERSVHDDLCVVDADSSQLAAVFAAKDGNSFVLQGPPGTGKSQTITNLVAQLVGDGKTVLFVSEKMAALEVVHRRLKLAGVGEFCLELHSNKSNKTEVIRQLAAPFELAGKRNHSEWALRADELRDLRASLNHFAEALHGPGPYGASVFGAASMVLKHASAPVVPLALDPPRSVTPDRINGLRKRLEAVEVAARDVGDPATHAWRGVPIGGWTPHAERTITAALDAAIEHARTVHETAPLAAQALALNLPAMTDAVLTRLDRASSVLATSPGPPREMLDAQNWSLERQRAESLAKTVQDRRATWSDVDEHFAPGILAMDLTELNARFGKWANAIFLIAFFMLWSARRSLKRVAKDGKLPSNSDTLEDLQRAVTVQERDETIARQDAAARSFLGPFWEGLDTDWDAIDAMFRWAEAYRALTLDLGDDMAGGALLAGREGRERLLSLATEERSLLAAGSPRGDAIRRFHEAWSSYRLARATLVQQLRLNASGNRHGAVLTDLPLATAQLRTWRGAIRELRDWCAWRDTIDLAGTDGAVTDLLARHADGALPGSLLMAAFERGLATWWIDEAVSTVPALREFRGTAQDARIERFRALDLEMQAIAREEVRSRLATRLPAINGPGEVALLRGELKKQRRHMPIRKLFSRIPHTLMKLKPCVLMSPLSVAQYLDPALSLFDVIVFDEASQIPPWDAIGAIARGRQMVVVGDSKQLPPTNFFQKADDDTPPDDDDMEELESILDECVRAGFVSHSLKWHYRSRHESLIAFSNHHYYDNRLHIFPAADSDVPALGVKWRHVPKGFYDKGKSRTNQAEAEAVVAEIARRLSDPAQSHKSIGVVTFSQAQQTLILDLLDELRQKNERLDPFFTEAVPEPVFVKNLENVQGDERDVMLFSICYAPDRAGKLAMNFGPLNRDGGERRLNVAITRARELLIVFSTLTHDQIDLARTKALGVAQLKTFLDYARRGPRAIDEAVALNPEADFESPFEEAVCNRLRAEGYHVDLQVGCAGYRIDLGIKHPDRPGSYMLGVECDGATYHSARSARDRDRLRQSVLESLGWRLFRIWSLDWWHDPERVMTRLRQAIEDARRAPLRASEATRGRNDARSKSGGAAADGTPETAPAAVDVEALLGADAAALTLPEHAADYRLAETPILGPRELWDVTHIAPLIAGRLIDVVAVEGPIHIDEATRRVGASWGASRATKRSVEKVQDASRLIATGARPIARGDYLWPPELDPTTWRSFRLHPDVDTRRAPEYLPPQEIANAAEWLISQSGSIVHHELVQELSRLFGYKATGKKVRDAMAAGIEHLVAERRAELTGDSLRPLSRD
ncbi:MAG: DUF3320 domain-containing protein [Deltaproteobacteria bacterium]|nr:MAG: DUF3320 domain-containing protein [Deltaproteobacteria bacterium]